MCGILFALNSKNKNNFVKRLETLKKRGPDEMSTLTSDIFMAGHTRNCIVNPLKGKQPIQDDTWVVLHNGEIYNGMNIKQNAYGENIYKGDVSDSFKILDLYKKKNPIEVPKLLDGVFAYCVYNKKTKTLYVARDPIGVIPLYFVKKGNELWISSELKAILNIGEPKCVKPGHIYSFMEKDNTVTRYTTPYPLKPPINKYKKGDLYKLLETSVSKRVYSDVPWGILLSGGLDSSVVCSLAVENENLSKSYPCIHTFSIGLKGSEDLKRAADVATYWNTSHHSVEFDVEEGYQAIQDVIYAIETYDVTTVRASIPMFLLGKEMKKCGIKMVLSGEGSDELLAGYLYNHKCPDENEVHKECILKMNRLHYHDCLRANKSLAVHGIECRVPFLDKSFVHHTMFKMAARDKLSQTHPDGPQMEKWTLRNDFMFMLKPLPQIISRQKEQFSDGVGNEWIEYLKSVAEKKYSDSYFKTKQDTYTFQPPQTKEALLYREIFNKFFSNCDKTVFYTDETIACSSEVALKWNKDFTKDPSAESLKI